MPLKSAALRCLVERLPMADARLAFDVDVLVREADADLAVNALRDAGFHDVPGHGAPPGEYHRPPLVDGLGVAVEVHVSTDPEVAPATAWQRSTAGAQPARALGIDFAVPSDAELMWNAVAHATRHAYNMDQDVKLKYWLDGAVLLRSGEDALALLASRLTQGEIPRAHFAVDWLWWADRLAGSREESRRPEAKGPPRFDLAVLLAWRLHLIRTQPSSSRWRERLYQEGTRSAVERERQPSPRTASLYGRLRRTSATIAARVQFAAWRALHRAPAESHAELGGGPPDSGSSPTSVGRA